MRVFSNGRTVVEEDIVSCVCEHGGINRRRYVDEAWRLSREAVQAAKSWLGDDKSQISPVHIFQAIQVFLRCLFGSTFGLGLLRRLGAEHG